MVNTPPTLAVMDTEAKWRQVETAYGTTRRDVVFALIFGRGANVREAIADIQKRSGIILDATDVLVELKQISGKLANRDLQGQKSRLVAVFYGLRSIDAFLTLHCPILSCQEIADMVRRDTGIRMSRTTIHKLATERGIKTQGLRTAFNRAVDKGRVDHSTIAAHIDYGGRETDYAAFQSRRVAQMRRHVYGESAHAFGLKAALLKKGTSHREVAEHLGVSTPCVRAWCALNNKVNAIYWKRLAGFLEVSEDAVFRAPPTASQTAKLERQRPSTSSAR